MSEFMVLQDTREKKPWDFSFFGLDQTRKIVKTGDYTIEGYEDKITIDRKRSVSELYQNLFKERDRFEREMVRMEGMEAYILCEFPYSDVLVFPDSMPLAFSKKLKKRAQIPVKYKSQDIIDRLELLTERHGVRFLFTDSRPEAQREAARILKEFYEENKPSG
jgi:hypothetical protein